MPLPSDDSPLPESSIAKPTGGLAGVFRGLTGVRLPVVRSPPQTPIEISSAPPTTASTPTSPNQSTNNVLSPPPLLSRASMSTLSTMRGLKDSQKTMLQALCSGAPSGRVEAANSLRFVLGECDIDSAMAIWYAGKDLIEPDQASDTRNAGWQLLTECVVHRDAEALHRHEFFEGIVINAHPDDFHLQLAALADLSKGGRDLSGFEYALFPLLAHWLSKCFEFVSQARKEASHARNKPNNIAAGQEQNFRQLFEFLLNVIRCNFSYADDPVICAVIDSLLKICVKTSVVDDLGNCISIFKAIVTFGAIPAERLGACVKLLGSIYSMVAALHEETWQAISIILSSHNGQAMVRHLLDVLRGFPVDGTIENDAIREVKGALSVLLKLLDKSTTNRFPQVPFSVLADGLDTTARAVRATRFTETSTAPAKIYTAIIRVINRLFDDHGDEGCIHPIAKDEDWTIVLRAAAECAKKPVNPNSSPVIMTVSEATPPVTSAERASEMLNKDIATLLNRLENLAAMKKCPEFIPRQTIVRFFSSVRHILPDSAARIILEYFDEFRCCSPSDLEWENNITLVLESFFMDRERSSEIRLMALRTITDANEMNDLIIDDATSSLMPKITRNILSMAMDELDIDVLQAVMTLMTSVAITASMDMFDEIITRLGEVFENAVVVADMRSRMPFSNLTDSNSSRTGPVALTTSNIIVRGYVSLFLKLMDRDGEKCSRLFDVLVGIASASTLEIDARLTAMKLLFGLRADFANRIFLTHDIDCDYVAALLCRTDESRRRKLAEEANKRHPPTTRLVRGVSFNGKDIQDREDSSQGGAKGESFWPHVQIWMHPDPEALSESQISRVLVSHIPGVEPMLAPPDGMSDIDSDRETVMPSHDDSDVEINVSGDDDEAPPFLEKEKDGDVEVVIDDENSLEYVSEAPSEALDITNITDANIQDLIQEPKKIRLSLELWMEAIVDMMSLATKCDWELYSFILVHLPSQLTNHALFCDSIDQIRKLRRLLCEQTLGNSFAEPPASAGLGLRRADIAICLYQSLTMVLSYHDHFTKTEEDEIVSAFVYGIGHWERCAKPCIHALSICCHEVPQSTVRCINQMLPLMAKIITQAHVAMHILEFLCVLGRLPNIYINFREEDYNFIFGICFRYLQYVRDKRRTSQRTGAPNDLYGGLPSATAATVTVTAAALSEKDTANDLPQYVYALAYHVITFWFLALKLPDRRRYVHWIAQNLFKDADGPSGPEEQAIVTMDFMQRMSFADVDESPPDPSFKAQRFGEIEKKNWLVGNSIVTIEQAVSTGWAQITKRQPSGTNSYVLRHPFTPPPAHQTSSIGETQTKILPQYFLLQFFSSLPQPHESNWPVLLPDDEPTARTLRSFDRNLSIDGHKIGVVYIGENQTHETEILANVSGSSDYVTFVNGLGTLTRLRGANFNTQGLDREYDTDGKFAFCWRDRVTEIVFHVTTQMPTNTDADPQLINKKKHIGNDFVNIIWNDSGLPFRFDTFPSDFNYVNIVITPESRSSFIDRREQMVGSDEGEDSAAADAPTAAQQTQMQHKNPFFRVKVMSKPGFPEISPAAETKMVSLRALPAFIRLVAMNASVFSLVWANRNGGEHVSSWRNRLREIKRLMERHAGNHNFGVSGPPVAPMSAGAGAGAGGSVSSGMASSGAGAGSAAGAGGVVGGSYFQPPSSASAFMHESMLGTSALPRPASSMRESLNSSLRRSSVATFFTGAAGLGSPAGTAENGPVGGSSTTSGETTTGGGAAGDNGGSIGSGAPPRLAVTVEGAEMGGVEGSVLDSLDFSRWA
ncbi:Tuberous sclerosis 2 -like protein [Ceratocystis fimbriata CBS 114723]|uniref:Tuberous sclerosis 2-like protein n=1 Tax=Ceratocystis fimbriata CBS 114723 TaxID=1035309 RepID=A0A2C5X7T9_9PEZI|nr:Tuberous sclerosis 2 -like protein [Ceratocystis fimbriata CBS 114723]